MSKVPTIKNNSPALEAQIKAQIATDPDTWEMPQDTPLMRRGRPSGATKDQDTIRLDKDVIAALKGSNAKGWQTRANALLRKALSL